MSIGKLKEFELNSGKWSTYCEIVEQYFLANDVKDDKKVPILIASVGTDTYELMVDLSSPKKPKELKYDDLIQLVSAHIEPKPSYLAERYKFRLTKQTGSDSVAQFAATLKRLAANCDFKTNLDENLRDQFICGLNSEATRQRLFCEEHSLDFRRAYRVALSLEAAAKNAAVVEQEPVGAIENTLHALHVRPTPAYGRGSGARGARRGGAATPTAGWGRGAGAQAGSTASGKGGSRQTQPRCLCCGDRGHDRTKCKFRDYVCKMCLKKGHLKKTCPNIQDVNYTSNMGMDGVGQIYDDDSNDSGDENIESSENGGSEGLYHVELTGREPVVAEVIVDGKRLCMHVDTGSPYACISEELYRELELYRESV